MQISPSRYPTRFFSVAGPAARKADRSPSCQAVGTPHGSESAGKSNCRKRAVFHISSISPEMLRERTLEEMEDLRVHTSVHAPSAIWPCTLVLASP